MLRPLFIASVLALACDGTSSQPPVDPTCTHPCDLAQTVPVTIAGDVPAASIAVTAPCGGGVADCGPSGCRSVNLYLQDAPPGANAGAPLVCHVTAVAQRGDVIERDLTATYLRSFCCSGYEFTAGGTSIDFSARDAGS